MERASHSASQWGLSPGATAALNQARGGDVEAFGSVCQELEEALWSRALHWCGDEHTAEDLVQEALVTAWRRLERFDGSCRFLTWVTGILLNLYRNMARKKKAVLQSDFEEDIAGTRGGGVQAGWAGLVSTVADPGQGPVETLLTSETNSMIRECLGRLPEEQRMTVQLRFFIGADLGEIAAAMGCPEGTVKSRLSHAVRKLAGMPELRNALLGVNLGNSI